MKEYCMIGRDIGIVIYADNAMEAKEKAEKELLQGHGGWVDFCDKEDVIEFNRLCEEEE